LRNRLRGRDVRSAENPPWGLQELFGEARANDEDDASVSNDQKNSSRQPSAVAGEPSLERSPPPHRVL
jgi:hypothetical protein